VLLGSVGNIVGIATAPHSLSNPPYWDRTPTLTRELPSCELYPRCQMWPCTHL